MKVRLSEKMLRMLRGVSDGPMEMMPVPYRKGAINTAEALRTRGLVVIFFGPNDGRIMHLTDTGRAVLSQTGRVTAWSVAADSECTRHQRRSCRVLPHTAAHPKGPWLAALRGSR